MRKLIGFFLSIAAAISMLIDGYIVFLNGPRHLATTRGIPNQNLPPQPRAVQLNIPANTRTEHLPVKPLKLSGEPFKFGHPFKMVN